MKYLILAVMAALSLGLTSAQSAPKQNAKACCSGGGCCNPQQSCCKGHTK